jgi:hypothetical protein
MMNTIFYISVVIYCLRPYVVPLQPPTHADFVAVVFIGMTVILYKLDKLSERIK